ncbi:hypothetical protein [Chryseobacterium sp. JV558]|uniref:hypothetical protein n=1 Tax=Chryseobacterium sp. JV558 TaxID=2663236 RepID=UPI00299F1D8B|nr:hypothetical protein [Chryseobacterium sp. JV558]MDW9380144.1 hypothetical protein [Chryseobacterium sp. JV558]
MSINWNSINDGLRPEAEEPVLLAKEPTEDLINNCRVGSLIVHEDSGEVGWFVGNDCHVITLSSRTYWAYLNEKALSIPDTDDEKILINCLQEYMLKLQYFEKKFQKLSECMMTSGKGTYPLDYFIAGILNRSLSLIYGFDTLLRSVNFIGALHLVRPHLDNYLRLSASWLVDNPHDFAKDVWEGVAVRNIRDRDGKKMTDAYLKEKATAEFSWIENVYNETSGFVHFSNKHIMNATTLSSEKERTLRTFIGKIDNNVSYQSKIEAVIGMIEISNLISSRVYGWIATKRIEG